MAIDIEAIVSGVDSDINEKVQAFEKSLRDEANAKKIEILNGEKDAARVRLEEAKADLDVIDGKIKSLTPQEETPEETVEG